MNIKVIFLCSWCDREIVVKAKFGAENLKVVCEHCKAEFEVTAKVISTTRRSLEAMKSQIMKDHPDARELKEE